MADAKYRYYCFDSTGRLHDTQWIDAESDDAVIVLVETKHPGSTCEIWSDKRMVARVTPDRKEA